MLAIMDFDFQANVTRFSLLIAAVRLGHVTAPPRRLATSEQPSPADARLHRETNYCYCRRVTVTADVFYQQDVVTGGLKSG